MFGILFGVGLGAALLYAFCYINIPHNKKSLLLALAVIGVVVMAVQLTAVEGMKYLWGRVRFRDLAAAGDYSAFTPWYHINGINGSKSFPSGHAAGAGMIFLAMLLPCASQKRSRYAVMYFAVPFAYTAAVAYTRLVMGAHYLSDVTAGALISFTLAVAAVKLFESRILPSITDKNRQ